MSRQTFYQVIVETTAIHDLIVSTAEAFNQESIGLLFGRPNAGRATVRRAFAFQIVSGRSSTDVRIDPKAQQRMQETIADLNGPGDFLGYFHSHPGIDSISSLGHLSEIDLAAMHTGEIEIVVSVQPAVDMRKHVKQRRGDRVECVVGRRRFTVSAYEAVSIDRHPFKTAEQVSRTSP